MFYVHNILNLSFNKFCSSTVVRPTLLKSKRKQEGRLVVETGEGKRIKTVTMIL